MQHTTRAGIEKPLTIRKEPSTARKQEQCCEWHPRTYEKPTEEKPTQPRCSAHNQKGSSIKNMATETETRGEFQKQLAKECVYDMMESSGQMEKFIIKEKGYMVEQTSGKGNAIAKQNDGKEGRYTKDEGHSVEFGGQPILHRRIHGTPYFTALPESSNIRDMV